MKKFDTYILSPEHSTDASERALMHIVNNQGMYSPDIYLVLIHYMSGERRRNGAQRWAVRKNSDVAIPTGFMWKLFPCLRPLLNDYEDYILPVVDLESRSFISELCRCELHQTKNMAIFYNHEAVDETTKIYDEYIRNLVEEGIFLPLPANFKFQPETKELGIESM